jgi:hypothetical protein
MPGIKTCERGRWKTHREKARERNPDSGKLSRELRFERARRVLHPNLAFFARLGWEFPRLDNNSEHLWVERSRLPPSGNTQNQCRFA